ncbi:MAG: hypothetical protein ABSG67_04025 [Thermoguttaceae bacterium]|jgi:hypothetical protein
MMNTSKLVASLQALIASLVELRTRDSAATRITFVNNEAVLSRCVTQPASASPAESIESLMALHSLWQPIGRMHRIINSPIFTELSRVVHLRSWRLASLPFQAAWACLAAKRLAERMGAELLCQVINDGAAGRNLFEAHGKCIDDLENAARLVENTAQQITQSITLFKSNPTGESTAALQFECEGQIVQVIHLGSQGQRLFQEPLEEFINRAASAQLSAFIESVERLRQRLPMHRATGDRLLQEICPQMASALKRVVRSGQFFGYRMFRGKSRGFPAEAILFIDPVVPWQDIPFVHFVVRRAHREFILENDRQPPQWFWFPPLQIQARILFTSSRHIWQSVPPEIRMSKMGPRFIHPYVGALEEDHFARALIINDDGVEADMPISPEAQKLFHGRLEPVALTRARDICLPGQMERIQTLEMHVRKSAGNDKIDLFDLVQGIWQLARQGLCRAHEGNTDRPRVPLDAENMFYPIPGRTNVDKNKLFAQLFQYNTL